MSLPVYYTPCAQETLQSVSKFILNKFGARPANNFLLKADKTVALISEQPFMFKASSIDKAIRVALITR